MSDFTMKRPEGSTKKKRIVGRGASGRRGATAGRGDKGQKSRSGGNVKPGFEGGQMPLFRRIARRGFNNAKFTKSYQVLNLSEIAKRYTDGDVVNHETLIAKGLVKRGEKRIKILGDGDLSVKLTVDVDAVSRSATDKIERAGGMVTGSEKVVPDGE
jgi:large subunit ribosomal protein L15